MSIVLFIVAGIVFAVGVISSAIAWSEKKKGDFESGYICLRNAELIYAAAALLELVAQSLR